MLLQTFILLYLNIYAALLYTTTVTTTDKLQKSTQYEIMHMICALHTKLYGSNVWLHVLFPVVRLLLCGKDCVKRSTSGFGSAWGRVSLVFNHTSVSSCCCCPVMSGRLCCGSSALIVLLSLYSSFMVFKRVCSVWDVVVVSRQMRGFPCSTAVTPFCVSTFEIKS